MKRRGGGGGEGGRLSLQAAEDSLGKIVVSDNLISMAHGGFNTPTAPSY